MPSRRWNDEHQPVPAKRRLPTARQVEVFLAFVRLSSIEAVAEELGIRPYTVHNHLSNLKRIIGATDTAHAAAILFDLLGDQYVLPTDWWRARYEEHRRR